MKVDDAGSDAILPSEAPADLRQMTEEKWMAKYGTTLANQLDFQSRHPNWHTDTDSWWYKSVGRSSGQQPLWLSDGYHFPELDGPPDATREDKPLHERAELPLWAERVGLRGGAAPRQSASIYGHRAEYLPAQTSGPATMHGRFQPSFARVQASELPDRTDRPDGRFWLAGVAQGRVSDPYRRGVSGIARRKPIVAGPRTVAAVIDGESHTLGNAFRDVAWAHPAVEAAGYSQEHPGYNHVNLRVQTRAGAGVSGEQGLAQSLELLKDLVGVVGEGMGSAMAAWEARQAG
ncbi:hypothetical protein ACKKBG_A20330 [Auxenochlorella protothecoides x Auxenochlorella symbiontica]